MYFLVTSHVLFGYGCTKHYVSAGSIRTLEENVPLKTGYYYKNMINLLQLTSLLRCLADLVAEIRHYVKEENNKQIGRDLYAVYSETNEVLSLGNEIADIFENLLTEHCQTNRNGHGDFDKEGYMAKEGKISRLRSLTKTQEINLDRLHDSLNNVEEKVRYLDPQFYRRGLELINSKSMWVGHISRAIEETFSPGRDQSQHLSLNQERFIRNYLSDSRPKQRLLEVESAMIEFHNNLSKHFSSSVLL